MKAALRAGEKLRLGVIRRARAGVKNAEIEARAAVGDGLTSPELAVLLAYTKIVLSDEVGRSELPDDPDLADRLWTLSEDLLAEAGYPVPHSPWSG